MRQPARKMGTADAGEGDPVGAAVVVALSFAAQASGRLACSSGGWSLKQSGVEL